MGIRELDTKRRNLTLDQLEGITSRLPLPDDTSLVTRCLRLRKVPICQFTVENLRLLIGQREGLMFLVPLALEHLESDPLTEGNLYPGDLLCTTLRAGTEFWQRHWDLRGKIETVVAKLSDVPREVAEALVQFNGVRE